MAVVVVGGQSRNVGKTAVVCAILRELPDLSWTAIKVTPHEHGLDPRLDFDFLPETSRDAPTDTSRYLAAGARRALLLRARPGKLALAVPALQAEIARTAFTVVESNSIVEWIRPDAYIVVVDPSGADVKDSVRRYLDRAQLLIVPATAGFPWGAARVGPGIWPPQPVRPPESSRAGNGRVVPVFPVNSPRFMSDVLLRRIRFLLKLHRDE